jgi:AcrR family transcriptional regulator
MTGTKPPSWRERQRAERELVILAEAERLLSVEGYEGLVLDRLADQVGVSKATLYLHFASKEDLVGAVMLRSMARLNDQLTRLAAENDRPVVQRLSAILAGLLEGDFSWIWTITGSQRHALAGALTDYPGLRDANLRFFDVLCTLIRQGQANGELDPSLPAPSAARFLLSLLQAQGRNMLPGETALSGKEFTALAIRFALHGLCVSSTT